MTAPRCLWECDAGEVRDELTGGRFICNLLEESVAHRHSPECPKDHEDWFACHGFVAPEAVVDKPGSRRAPWSSDEVAALIRHQASSNRHPYTCLRSSHRVLVPTTDGWVCLDCDYRQDWARADDTVLGEPR